MARGRIQNRMEKRAEHEAYERRQAEDEDNQDDDEEDDEEDDDDEEASAEEESGDEEAAEDEEPPPKKKKAAKEPKKPRSRSHPAKIVRVKLVWGVFNNSNARVATYEYRQKPEAEEHATRLTTEKKSTHFVQPVKEPIEEK